MKATGIMIFDRTTDEWTVWVGQEAYWIDQGYLLEMRIGAQYIGALLGKSLKWCVLLDHESYFILDEEEVYKVRIEIEDYHPVKAPF